MCKERISSSLHLQSSFSDIHSTAKICKRETHILCQQELGEVELPSIQLQSEVPARYKAAQVIVIELNSLFAKSHTEADQYHKLVEILFEAVKHCKPVSSSEHFTMLNKSCKGFPFKRRRRRPALLRSPGRRCTLQSQMQDTGSHPDCRPSV